MRTCLWPSSPSIQSPNTPTLSLNTGDFVVVLYYIQSLSVSIFSCIISEILNIVLICSRRCRCDIDVSAFSDCCNFAPVHTIKKSSANCNQVIAGSRAFRFWRAYTTVFFRTEPVKLSKKEFQKELIQNYRNVLSPEAVIVDSFTVEPIRQKYVCRLINICAQKV